MSESLDVARLYLCLARLSRLLRRDAPAGPLGHGSFSALITLVKQRSVAGR